MNTGNLLKFVLVPLMLFWFAGTAYSQTNSPVAIKVDLVKDLGAIQPIWAWFGYDEPNYTTMKDGKKLLKEIAMLSKVPVNVRVHSLLVTGDGKAAIKWGSTNAYTEDANGKPIYNWTIIDSIFDTFISNGMHPIAQIGFMPEAMSVKPTPYKHHWKPGDDYNDIYTGWAYPPKDYSKFAELVYQWVKHSIARYGKEEVSKWHWELWNEPDISYWKGTTEEYIKLYDYTADAVKRAFPAALVGGPETTDPSNPKAAAFLKTFLTHVTSGKNYVTGKTGSPIDFITFHAKGSPTLVNGVVQMNMGRQLTNIDKGFEIVASFPTLKKLPIIIGESDPEGCAACSEDVSPQNAYRNGTMYSSYTAASFARKYDLAMARGVNLRGAVTWAFEFEDQPWFRGFRDLATNGVDKPVLNVFRMFGMMQGNRAEVNKDLQYNFASIRDSSVRRNEPDVNAIATKDKNTASVMVWNYHDLNDTNVPDAPVIVELRGIPVTKVLLRHYRIDKQFSNSYEVWKSMGSPKNPDKEQIAKLETAGQLQLYTSPEWVNVKDGKLLLDFPLPRQGVSLLQLSW
ncbi:beta-xylosidase [Mucilaginibacter sp. JRF]|uniref:GH39 family glycosyl hydrolase n=1 Tax=Mucilaginibacter sp. JRF TaxID=2780088 RepID=UPI0018812E06|nr:beta-xylosidase [Mucilaginibacter sp. JRF]MBE9583152.1 beta-xylosidase [Mucilaginibacter sp. JRF]